MLGQNTNAFRYNDGYYNTLNILRNPKNHLDKMIMPSSGALEYRFKWKPDFVLKEPQGSDVRVGTIVVSPNGRWMAVEAVGRGVVHVDLLTEEIKLVSRARWSSSDQSQLSNHIAISDDGKYIAASGTGTRGAVITVDDGCGIALSEDEQIHGGRPIDKPCEELELDVYFRNTVTDYAHAVFPVFSSDGASLNINVYSYSQGAQWVTLRTGEDNPPLPSEEVSLFDYVALGDSYSSGEGDTKKDLLTGQKYYLPFTDVTGDEITPKEMCHISSRSYPFILTNKTGMADTRMRSIACSGALIKEDYAQENNNYYGQGERLKVLGSDSAIKAYKADALNEFIPGRNQQVEFIREYKPKAITLTGGGNDAGFGDIAIACAPMKPIAKICDYANSDEGKSRLGQGIAGRYSDLVRLYNELHSASPNTKIYVLGYPQFISAGKLLPCSLNVAFNDEERIMIRAAVSFINSVIEAAARTAGVKYIDIEQSLGSNILCGEKESYVTGLARSGKVTANISEIFSQESFHPNAKGHQKIAETVNLALGNMRIDEYEYCPTPGETHCPEWPAVEPEVPDFFAGAVDGNTKNYVYSRAVDRNILQKGKDTLLIRLKGLKPNATSKIQAFSDPVNLGTYTTNTEGALSVDIPIPDSLAAGAHTLQIESETFSDEPLALWQIMWILGSDGDSDEDGVQDSLQSCLFLQDSGLDSDNDGIDDSCDAEIAWKGSSFEGGGSPEPPQQGAFIDTRARYVEAEKN